MFSETMEELDQLTKRMTDRTPEKRPNIQKVKDEIKSMKNKMEAQKQQHATTGKTLNILNQWWGGFFVSSILRKIVNYIKRFLG